MIVRLGVAALLLAACGSGPGADSAADTGAAFEDALDEQDFARACGLLSPTALASLEGDCPTALHDADLPATPGRPRSEVYGTSAQLRFPGEVLFAGLFPGGWRVVAAGCAPRQDRPYECSVDGG